MTDQSRQIAVAIIEDHQMLSDALVSVINSTSDLVVVGSSDTCAGGLALLDETRPDVLVLDVALPDGDGLDLVPAVRRRLPQVSILVMTSLSDTPTLKRAIDAGVNGFLPKQRPAADLLAAIRQAAAGEIVIPPSLLLGLLKVPDASGTVVNRRRQPLTGREREILSLLARGSSGPQIAAALNIAPPTVRTHIGNLLAKLGVHSRLEAVALALREGLIDSPF